MLNNIRSPKDVKKIQAEKLTELCAEIRETLIQKISTQGEVSLRTLYDKSKTSQKLNKADLRGFFLISDILYIRTE